MKKGLWLLGAAALFAMSSQVQAKQKVCVFDLLGRAGESYKLLEEWRLSAQTWVEATAFAWLAMRFIQQLSGNLATVTGASGDRILGTITAV